LEETFSFTSLVTQSCLRMTWDTTSGTFFPYKAVKATCSSDTPSALSLPLPKGDESTFEVLGNVLHTLVERAPCCLSCSSQLGELVADAANAGHPPAAPAGHDGGTVDVVVGKPSEPGRNTHDPRQQLQPVPVSTPTEGGLSRTEAATGDLQPSHSTCNFLSAKDHESALLLFFVEIILLFKDFLKESVESAVGSLLLLTVQLDQLPDPGVTHTNCYPASNDLAQLLSYQSYCSR